MDFQQDDIQVKAEIKWEGKNVSGKILNSLLDYLIGGNLFLLLLGTL